MTAAVCELIWQRFGVRLAVRTTGTYLARWGFTATPFKVLGRAHLSACDCMPEHA